jgi:hypothetical protein
MKFLLCICLLLAGCASASYTKITHTYKQGDKEYLIESVYSGLEARDAGPALRTFMQSVYLTPVPISKPVPTSTHDPKVDWRK